MLDQPTCSPAEVGDRGGASMSIQVNGNECAREGKGAQHGSRRELKRADLPDEPAREENGETPDANLVKLAGLRSRHNTYMSVPLLWTMIGQHTTYFAGGNLGIPGNYFWVFLLVIIAVGWHIVFQCYKKSTKVQGF